MKLFLVYLMLAFEFLFKVLIVCMYLVRNFGYWWKLAIDIILKFGLFDCLDSSPCWQGHHYSLFEPKVQHLFTLHLLLWLNSLCHYTRKDSEIPRSFASWNLCQFLQKMSREWWKTKFWNTVIKVHLCFTIVK